MIVVTQELASTANLEEEEMEVEGGADGATT